jgi:hypothetical protein
MFNAKEVKGYKNLTQDDATLFQKFLQNFYQAWGLKDCRRVRV